jgi:hypothetical protein
MQTIHLTQPDLPAATPVTIPTARAARDLVYLRAYTSAILDGVVAAAAADPSPLPCGGATVVLKPGNRGLARWLRAEGLGRPRYGLGGISLLIPPEAFLRSRSMQRPPSAARCSARSHRSPPPAASKSKSRPISTDMGRFESKYTDPQLERIVRLVVESVDPDFPTTVPPGSYDAALPGSGWPDAPKAAGLRKRWNIDWYETLDVIYDPVKDFQRLITLRRRRRPRALPGVAEIIYALQLVAAHLGLVTLRPTEYDDGREQLIEIAGRRWRHGDDRVYLLPTSTEIQVALDRKHHAGWDLALALAGLEPRPPVGGQAGETVEVMMERFLQDIGCLPWSDTALKTYAKLKGLSLERHVAPFAARRSAFAELRRDSGRWTPTAPPPIGERPPLDAERDPDAAVRSRVKWASKPREEFVAALSLVYAELETGQRLTQPLHRMIAQLPELRGRVPHPSSVTIYADKHGCTAAELRDEAERLASREVA